MAVAGDLMSFKTARSTGSLLLIHSLVSRGALPAQAPYSAWYLVAYLHT